MATWLFGVILQTTSQRHSTTNETRRAACSVFEHQGRTELISSPVYGPNMAETRPVPIPGKVAAIKIPCNGERGALFIPVEIDENDPIFTDEVGFTAPVSRKIELPLRMRKCSSSDKRGFERAALDNQVATYLMIETGSGLAKMIWQTNVGTVIVAREDKKPLSEEHLEAFWSYNSALLDRYGDDDSDSVEKSITQVNFGKFFKYNYNRPRATDFVEEWNKA